MDNHFQFDLAAEAERLFDESSRTSIDPRAVIIAGGVAAGKTTLRVREYSRGFVLIDAAEMFHHFCRGDEGVEFPGPFTDALEIVGRAVARRALLERRNIVTEIIGAEVDEAMKLIDALKSVGYRVELMGVTCCVEEALRRNEERGDSVSAYYAEDFQRAWIIDACACSSSI